MLFGTQTATLFEIFCETQLDISVISKMTLFKEISRHEGVNAKSGQYQPDKPCHVGIH